MQLKGAKSIRVVIFSFLIFLLILKCSLSQTKRGQEKIENCKASTIGYISRIDKSGRTQALKYYFYVDSTKFLAETGMVDADCLHKYYLVKYNRNNPNEHIILLNQEMKPDSLSRVQAGFKKEKIYYYDNVTSTYKDKLEWK